MDLDQDVFMDRILFQLRKGINSIEVEEFNFSEDECNEVKRRINEMGISNVAMIVRRTSAGMFRSLLMQICLAVNPSEEFWNSNRFESFGGKTKSIFDDPEKSKYGRLALCKYIDSIVK